MDLPSEKQNNLTIFKDNIESKIDSEFINNTIFQNHVDNSNLNNTNKINNLIKGE